jgi:DNA repair exonuclease SbcCD ATPase subunit
MSIMDRIKEQALKELLKQYSPRIEEYLEKLDEAFENLKEIKELLAEIRDELREIKSELGGGEGWEEGGRARRKSTRSS